MRKTLVATSDREEDLTFRLWMVKDLCQETGRITLDRKAMDELTQPIPPIQLAEQISHWSTTPFCLFESSTGQNIATGF